MTYCPKYGKEQFDTPGAAHAQARRVTARAREGRRMNVYKCLACKCWHVGHSNPWREKPRRRAM